MESYTQTPHNHSFSAVWAQIIFLRSDDLVVPKLLHADVSDGQDLSRHQQEVAGGQLVTMSLVPGTVDSDVTSECHLCCPPHLPTEEVSSLDGSWGLCASRLKWKKIKMKVALAFPCLFPLLRGTESGPGIVQADWLTAFSLCACVNMGGGTVLWEHFCLIWIWIALSDKC